MYSFLPLEFIKPALSAVHVVICLFLRAYFLFQGYDLSFQKKRSTTQPCPPTTLSPPSSRTLFLHYNYSSSQLQWTVRVTWSEQVPVPRLHPMSVSGDGS